MNKFAVIFKQRDGQFLCIIFNIFGEEMLRELSLNYNSSIDLAVSRGAEIVKTCTEDEAGQ